MPDSLYGFCRTDFWDQELTWSVESPDFTQCFQDTALIWVPFGLLLILIPYEIYNQRRNKEDPIPWNFFNILKLICTLALIVIETLKLIWLLVYVSPLDFTPAAVSSPIITIVGYLVVGLMIITGRKSGLQSSIVLFMFWLFQFLCILVTYYSKILNLIDRPALDDVTVLGLHLATAPLVLLQFLLTFIPDQLPPTKLYTVVENVCPEQSSSHLSQLLFLWLDPLMIAGYKSPLKQNQLWNLEKKHRSENVVKEFDYHWNNELQKAKESGWDVTNKATSQNEGVYLPSLSRALFKNCWKTLLIATIQLIICDLLVFVSPKILDLIITHVSSNEPLWKGIIYGVIMFITTEVRSLIRGQYYVRMFVVGMKIRISITSAVYKKALLISNKERQESTVGEIVNLMAIDTQRFIDLMPYMLMLASTPLQIALALYMLSDELGISVVAGVIVILLMGPANAVIGNILRKLQIKDMVFKDERTKLINEILDGIKVLKLYAWEIPFGDMVQVIRDKEINVLRSMAYYNAGMGFLWICAPFLVSLASFTMFVLLDEKNVLTANIAFVSLSLFDLLRIPLNVLPILITALIQVSVSIKRLNKFLRGEELDPTIVTNKKLGNDDIVIEDGTFAWGGQDDEPTLTGIDLKVPKGKLVAVVGQVGSGKSSFISSILGELNKRKGTINVQGSVAYVPQQAWIQNATVRDNILMYSKFDKSTYDKILDACALKSDLEILQGGDQTEIGEKGINLSGGQKQRVSVARAVYRDSDIYLLDDPLSAVDSHVGKHIFDKVIGPSGILNSKTRVFVTNGISYLPVCDAVVVLKDGVISEMGTYQELLMNKGAFSDFLNQYLSQKAEELDDEDLEQLDEILSKVPVSPDVQRQVSKRISESESESLHGKSLESSIKRRRSSVRSSFVKPPAKNTEKVKLIQDESMETAQVEMGVYIAYVRKLGWFIALLVVLMWVGGQAASVGSNVWLSEWSTDPILPDGTVDPNLRNMRLGVYGALGLTQGLGVVLGAFGLAYGSMRAANQLHREMLDCVLRSPMSFFDTTPIGRIVNRFSKDVNVMDFSLMQNFRGWVTMFLQVISVIIVDTIETPLILVALIPSSVLYYFAQGVYIASSRQLKRLESVSRSPIYTHFKESVSGAPSIRAYKVQEIFIDESNDKVDTNMVSYYPSVIANRWLAVRLEFFGSLIVLFAVLFAVLSKDILDPGSVGLSVSYAMTITTSLTEMVRMSSELETNIVSVERILEYSVLQPEAAWNNDYNKSNASWPETGKVSFNSYGTRYRKELDPVLRGISCNIEPGEKIGICGRTGAGKSSLTLALFRIIEATEGSIFIDNIDISKLGLHNLRSRLTIIPQDPVLFSGTLRQNLDPFGTTRDEDIWSALEHAHLKTFASNVNKGLDYVVAEGGENMSVGQRQLICLARALLRKTKILILDEATAAVDLETDDLIQATIRKEFADSTILTIAHRLNTIMDSTRILVLDQGKIAEFDTPQNLLDDKKSIFYGMAEDAGLI